MSDTDPRVIRRLNAIIVLLVVPYVAGAVAYFGGVLVPLVAAGVAALVLLFLYATVRTLS